MRILLVIMLLFIAAAFLCLPLAVTMSYADNQIATPVKGNAMINLNDQDLDKLFKAEEEALKKIKLEHVKQERKQHLKDTDLAYQEALILYRQRRLSQAKEVLNSVEDLTPYYKSTDALLKSIDRQKAEELRFKPRHRHPENPQQVHLLENKASMLYRQTASLADNGVTAIVERKIDRLMQSFRQMSQRIYIQGQLKRIAKEADKYQQEIFRLTQARRYSEAKKKYADFQDAMIRELKEVKETIVLANDRYIDRKNNDPSGI